MTYSLRSFAEVRDQSKHFDSNPALIVRLGDQQSRQSLFSLGPLQTLRRVSGRLSRLLHGRDKVQETPRRLLVVDDEESICFSMSEYFTHHGFIVETASNVDQAERMIKPDRYQIIIQDLRLGTRKNSDGLEIIRFAHECSPDTRIIVLTAYGSTEVETEARASGADAFLRKPQPLSQVAQVARGLIDSPRRRAPPTV